MVTLETERLMLRPLCKADCPAMQRWASVPENVTYMPWGPNTDADTLKFLESCEQNWSAEPIKKYDFGIVLRETGELIGACKIDMNDELRTGEIGWILRRDFWKRGLATEAAGALIRYSFVSLGAHRLIAECLSENTGSWRVMEHCGMRREAHYLSCRRGRNVDSETWIDAYGYAILEEEYLKKRQSL